MKFADRLDNFGAEIFAALNEKKIAGFVCMAGSGGQKALDKLEKLLPLCARMILVDPMERPLPDNDALIQEFCAKV